MDGCDSVSLTDERDDSTLDEFNLESQGHVLFANAALFVLPSDLEGMPIVLLEALSYSTPVLASDVPLNREVLGSFGQTFTAGSVEDLGRSLAECSGGIDRLRIEAQRAGEVVGRDSMTGAAWPAACSGVTVRY